MEIEDQKMQKKINSLGPLLIAAGLILLIKVFPFITSNKPLMIADVAAPSIILLLVPVALFIGGTAIIFSSLDLRKKVQRYFGIALVVMGIGVVFIFKPPFPYSLLGWGLFLAGVLIIVFTEKKFTRV